jgi:hypothetical protein
MFLFKYSNVIGILSYGAKDHTPKVSLNQSQIMECDIRKKIPEVRRCYHVIKGFLRINENCSSQ